MSAAFSSISLVAFTWVVRFLFPGSAAFSSAFLLTCPGVVYPRLLMFAAFSSISIVAFTWVVRFLFPGSAAFFASSTTRQQRILTYLSWGCLPQVIDVCCFQQLSYQQT